MSWIDDGQGVVKPGSTPEEFVIEGKERAGTPSNARFSTAVSPENSYFEVSVVNASENCFVGVTTTNSFKKGWGCKGLLFGRNLSSGGALVHGDYGPAVVTGSTVGVLAEFQGAAMDRRLALTFWHDGKCLGPAFLSRVLPDAEIFPMVQCGKDGDRFAIKFAAAPAMDGAGAAAGDPREGKWMLAKLKVGEGLEDVPLSERMGGDEVILTVEAQKGGDPGRFSFSFRVVNSCSMEVASVADEAAAPWEVLAPGSVASTMMMGEPGPMEVEQRMTDSMANLAKWRVSAEGELLLSGPGVEMELTPAGPAGGAPPGAAGDASGEGLPATSVNLE